MGDDFFVGLDLCGGAVLAGGAVVSFELIGELELVFGDGGHQKLVGLGNTAAISGKDYVGGIFGNALIGISRKRDCKGTRNVYGC